jgi:hypothetical protein
MPETTPVYPCEASWLGKTTLVLPIEAASTGQKTFEMG